MLKFLFSLLQQEITSGSYISAPLECGITSPSWPIWLFKGTGLLEVFTRLFAIVFIAVAVYSSIAD